MTYDYEDALDYSSRWIDLIHKNEFPTVDEAHTIISESTHNFAEYYNRNWLEYRKSVTESGDWAAVEWGGSGAVFKDVLGREYLDFLGGYGMMDLGWSHPDVVSTVRAQLERSPMPSQELLDPLRGVLAKLLASITPGDLKYSWFGASGTEANEAAMKIAKLYTGKTAFIVGVRAFHGKTMGSLSLIGKSDFRASMGAMYGGQVYHVPFGDADAVEKQLEICEKVGIGVAAVMFEPIQGESGAIVPPDDFWPRIRAATKKHGVLLIADEVQTGLGRTGRLWGVEHWNVVPDILTVAKSLGGGVMPISAVVTTEEIFHPMMYPNPFMHTTTTGGGALACSAAIAAIHITLREKLWEQAADKGAYLIPQLEKFASQYPQIYEKITGKGLLIGMHFKTPEIGYKVASGLFKRSVLVAGTLTSAQTVRVEPPLIVAKEQMDMLLDRLGDTLKEIGSAV
ncbi:MAG: aminotransferase class III-fold pyridoxal phosphate-dependent enzyme [Anaerolineales bacterium]|nr:aminotransferase class III-fold pyridoxal phosphate-dependent enzyme [Anaerolineales bacterium]